MLLWVLDISRDLHFVDSFYGNDENLFIDLDSTEFWYTIITPFRDVDVGIFKLSAFFVFHLIFFAYSSFHRSSKKAFTCTFNIYVFPCTPSFSTINLSETFMTIWFIDSISFYPLVLCDSFNWFETVTKSGSIESEKRCFFLIRTPMNIKWLDRLLTEW